MVVKRKSVKKTIKKSRKVKGKWGDRRPTDEEMHELRKPIDWEKHSGRHPLEKKLFQRGVDSYKAKNIIQRAIKRGKITRHS